jgi:hypothetical protein
MKESNQFRFLLKRVGLIAAIAMGLGAASPPLLADKAGAFLGGMIAAKVLTNMDERTQAEQYQAAAAMQQSQASYQSPGAPSVEERIHTLDQLRANGSISQSEYESRRKAILDSI